MKVLLKSAQETKEQFFGKKSWTFYSILAVYIHKKDSLELDIQAYDHYSNDLRQDVWFTASSFHAVIESINKKSEWVMIISDNKGHITKIRGSKLYISILQELNNNRIKYGHVHGMLKKAINLAFATNSYEELIGICQDFLVRKQNTLDQNQVKEILNNEELDLVNPIITVKKERPPGRVKNAVEIQNKESRKHCLKSINLNVQKGNNRTQLIGNSRGNRKTCQNCGQKGHNRTTCKFTG
ncbi:hypothetical protein GLOIN_2v1474313 [Rhizophagus irregularis DAOM 181602=DAOM 197198]|nr:hypothetical protein GLOIN_2v1474313 [Rhizophagus irregularis DAOM 181602=DAOM 197198]CAG8693427.1 17071_t:CDS:2 [Rhizophagus irregularis]